MTHVSSTEIRMPLDPRVPADETSPKRAAIAPALAGYHIITDAAQLPAIADGHLYNYLLAGNGLYLHAQRRELTALMRIAPAQVRGLPPLRSRLRTRFPRVPMDLVSDMVRIAAEAARAPGGGLEVLVYLAFQEGGWRLTRPPQEQTLSSVQLAHDVEREAFMEALIDVHSHPFPLRDFSTTDDASDRGAFRFAVLIADPAGAPSLHSRLCVYGVFVDVPPALLFDLPDDLEGTPA